MAIGVIALSGSGSRPAALSITEVSLSSADHGSGGACPLWIIYGIAAYCFASFPGHGDRISRLPADVCFGILIFRCQGATEGHRRAFLFLYRFSEKMRKEL